MINVQYVGDDWYPKFVDYFHLSFTTAAAFSPTDVSAIRPWAKLMMMAEETIVISPPSLPVENKFPSAIICKVKTEAGEGFLIDAFYDSAFQQRILSGVISAEARTASEGNLRFFSTARFRAQAYGATELPSKVLSADHSNTCVLYGDRFFLKLFRKVDYSINPDVEITDFLTRHEFKNIPALLGSVQWQTEKRKLRAWHVAGAGAP